jgi:hypothetical protein
LFTKVRNLKEDDMRRTLFCVSVLVALAGWSCSSVSVSVDFDRDTDFSQYKTFSWLGQQHKPPPRKAAEHSFFEKRLMDAVEAELLDAGYKRSRMGKPDFLIAYHIGARDKVDVTKYGYRYGPHGRWVGRQVEVVRYKQGTLILDFVDAASKDLVWRGTAVGAIRDMTAGEAEIRGVVAKVLAGFPPAE